MSRLRSIGLFLSLAALWGGSFPAIKAGLEFLPPLLFAAFRYDIGGLLLLGYLVVSRADWRPRTRDDYVAIAASGAFLIAGNSVLFVGQQFTTSAVASIVYSLIPVLTTVFAWVVLPGERRSPLGLVGLVVGLAGVAIIARPDPGNLLTAGIVGQLLVLVAAASVALGSVLVRRSSPSLSIGPLTGWSMLAGALFLHVASAALGELDGPIRITPISGLTLLYLGVFASAVGYLIYFDLLGRYGPLEINLVSYVVPIVATLTGWVLLNERITVTTGVGFLVIFFGFVLLKYRALSAELFGQPASGR